MSEPVTATAQSIYQDLKTNAPHLRAAVAAAREAAVDYLKAKRAVFEIRRFVLDGE